MRAKVCGIRNLEDAMTAISAGANALGFLVGITHLAEDKISKEEARDIILKLPPFVSRVLVTHLTERNEIIELATYLNVDTIQIHDYISPADMDYIKVRLPYCKLIKAIHVIEKEEAYRLLDDFVDHCDAILLDSRTRDRLGGTGLTHDWEISREIVKRSKLPVILAGGLNDKNTYEAVKKVRPYAIDANSGLEENGYKSYHKIKSYIEFAVKAEEESNESKYL